MGAQASVTDAGGSVCAPACQGTDCPTDVPEGVTAQPTCALQDQSGNKYSLCFVIQTISATQLVVPLVVTPKQASLASACTRHPPTAFQCSCRPQSKCETFGCTFRAPLSELERFSVAQP